MLGQAAQVGVETAQARTAWQRWAQGPPGDDPEELAGHLEDRLDALTVELHAVRQAAQAVVDRKESQWRPIAQELAEWVGPARRANAPVG